MAKLLATVVTPNLDEASVLLNRPLRSVGEMRDAAAELYRKFEVPFLLKGGHLKLTQAIDFLADRDGVRAFSKPFYQKVSTHGTGCVYSAAIAANLALNRPLAESIAAAKQYISEAVRKSFRWDRNGRILFALRR